jgi:4-amino-4-deoxy-L-arabinose transferase-like glycosyltransferase
VKQLPIIIITIVFAGLAALYSVVVPLGEGPDEPGHISYVFFLARERRLPDQRKSEVPGEGHQPPLAYALAAPLAAWQPADQLRADMPGNPRFTWAGPSRDAGPVRELNAVAHGSREYWPWRGMVLAWHLARLVSVACGAATVVFTYLAARALVDERRKTKDESAQVPFVLRPSSFVPVLAAALVAFNPQFLFMSALATNDALLTALSAALLWLAVRNPERRNGGAAEGKRAEHHRYWRAISIGTTLGLALITKQSAIILVPIALLAAVWQPGGAFPHLRRAAASLLAMLAVALAFCGWWYARNLRLYGDPFGLAVFQAEFVTQAFDPRSPSAWLGALAQLHDSFWARFGWMNVAAPGWVIGVFVLVEALALAGWVRWVVRDRETGRQGDRETGRQGERRVWRVSSLVSRVWAFWCVLALPLLALAWVVSFALTAGLVAWQGRLLFPALPAIAILMACGLASWQNRELRTKNRTWRNSVWFLVLGSWFCLALWLPFGVIRPAYPIHTLPERVALERIGTPVYGRLGLVGDPGAELRSWRIDGDARPGGAVGLTLMWHALGRQNRSWTVFIHLVDAQEQILAEDNTQPRGGAFPMKQWIAGDWVEDRHTLALPATLPPGTYTLRVGLFDPRTDRRAAVFDQAGKLAGDLVKIGQLTVR